MNRSGGAFDEGFADRLPVGLAIAAVPEREDARDVLVTQERSCTCRSACRRAHRHRQPATTSPVAASAQRCVIDADPRQCRYPAEETRRGRSRCFDHGRGRVEADRPRERIGEYLPDEICVSAVAQGALASKRAKRAPYASCWACFMIRGRRPRRRGARAPALDLAADARCRSAREPA